MKEAAKQINAFKKFILRGNVVDLAVAVVVGAAFSSIVDNLVKGMITPLIGAIGGQPNFASLYFTINGSKFMYGNFINAILSFVIIAAVVFFLIVQPLNKLMAHVKPSEEVDKPSERACPECLSGIPAEATRCKYCTAVSEPSRGLGKTSKKSATPAKK
jgi:large conductance mechanosensitive channel